MTLAAHEQQYLDDVARLGDLDDTERADLLAAFPVAAATGIDRLEDDPTVENVVGDWSTWQTDLDRLNGAR